MSKPRCITCGNAYPCACEDQPVGRWTGPRETDLNSDGITLLRPVPAERWPFGPPSAHYKGCSLFAPTRGLYCDCQASAADEGEGGPL